MPKPRALVIGGSVGGLFAAHLLRLAGWDIAVFERARGDLGDRGTGIGTRAELFAVMRRIGIAVDLASIGVNVQGRTGLGADGTVVHELSMPAVNSAWSRVWRPLRAALPGGSFHGGMTLTRIEHDADGVTAHFADGTSVEGELLVAADGLHSIVCMQLWPGAGPQYAGYVAWRGVVEQGAVAPELQELLFDRMVFGCPAGELFLSLPMPGPDDGPLRGNRRCHFVWFRPVAEEALPSLCTDASGRAHGISIPPPLIRPELIAALRRDADALLAPQLAASVKATGQTILQPIFDVESPAIACGRVALLGDAAFVARPHVATGVMKAGMDAACLADSLAATKNLPSGLAAYDAERRPYGRWLVERGRHIGATAMARDLPFQQRIETLMREYGAAGVVRDQPIAARLSG